MKNPIYGWTFIFLTMLGIACDSLAQTEKPETVVKDGSRVSLQYTLSDGNGTVIDSNRAKQPLTYTQGQSQILPALEKSLEGMKAGDHKTVMLKPEEAYGQVDPNAFREIPKAHIPPDALKVGTRLTATSAEGKRYPVRVHEIKETVVVVDFNHLLAGKTLSFDVMIVDVGSETK